MNIIWLGHSCFVAESAGWRFPALSWLEESIAAFPKTTQVMLVLPPALVRTIVVTAGVVMTAYYAWRYWF